MRREGIGINAEPGLAGLVCLRLGEERLGLAPITFDFNSTKLLQKLKRKYDTHVVRVICALSTKIHWCLTFGRDINTR